MPLVRFPVRNEYGLGHSELYKEAERDDPKALLQGVAVAGLVGILRQLGDLAEFASEVFHGLQEEVTNTSSRSRKMMVRVQRIEAALPSLENSMLSQKSHLHFAYTSGSVWHPRLQVEKNHLIRSDLPQFIMDSYEECSDPPRFHVLDKFDSGGPGSCLKRYSDPTFFKKASAFSDERPIGDKYSKNRKSLKSKKKKARQRNVSSRDPSVSSPTDRPQFSALQAGVRISPPPFQPVSTTKSDQEEEANAYDLRTGSSYIECVFHPTDPIKPEEREPEQVSISNSQILPDNSTFDLASIDECTRDVDDDHYGQIPLQEQVGASSSSVSWEEKTEIVESVVHQHEHVEAAEILGADFHKDDEEKGEVTIDNVGEIELSVDDEDLFTFVPGQTQPGDLDSEPDNFMDALNNIESESETDTDFQTKHEVERSFNPNNNRSTVEVHNPLPLHADDIRSTETKQEMNQYCNSDNDITKDEICESVVENSNIQSTNLASSSAADNGSYEEPSLDNVKDGIFEFVVDNSNIQSTNLESSFAADNGSYEEPPFDNVFSSEFRVPEELPKSAEEPCKVGISLNNSIVESVNTESLRILSGADEKPKHNLTSNEDQNALGGCQTNNKENSGVQPVQIWTNGSLLGLQPSKPPVFVAPNTVSEGSVDNDKIRKTDELAQSSEIIGRNSSKCSTSYQDDSNAISEKKTSWRFLSAVLDTKRENNGYFQISKSFNNNLAHSFGRMNGMSNTEQKLPADGRALCSEASHGDMSNGSQISVLSNRIPLNDFQRSLIHNQGLGYRALNDRTSNGYNGGGSLMHSPSSSPPLQHMKISFQPENDVAASKLKLKFPDGSFCHESGSYMLPSFQLVPEPSSSQRDIGSGSDDDTFCRSSPYMSEDRTGNESESDSEQWDSDDDHQSNENKAYNGIHDMSIKESEGNRHESVDVDYGFQNLGTEKCSESSQASVLPDLPSLSSMNPLFEQEMKILSDENNFPKLHLPQPPPLPPSEWQNMKVNSNVTVAKQETNFEESNHENDLKFVGSTIAPIKQRVLASTFAPEFNLNLVKQQLETKESEALPPRRELERRKSTGQNEESLIRKGIVVDEKEDFLHQIRAKSFNLRRTGTMTEKLNVTNGLANNAKVTAILAKASAIRQVVGSDDGEDEDSWSEA